jgi:hypothetical protein
LSTKAVTTRIQHKHDLEVNWLKAVNFVPMQGELIIYDAEVDANGQTLTLPTGRTTPYTYERFKIGDGKTTVSNLPFNTEPIENKIKISGTVTKAIGGIAKDKEYTNADIADVLSDLLFPYVAPSFSSISTSASSGTFEYGTTRTITKVTPTFTKGSKNITSVKIGTTSGGSDLYSGTSATSGTAITLTTTKTYNGTTGGTIYCTISDGTTPVTKSAAVSYTYYDYSKLTTGTSPDTSGATKQTSSGADNTYSYTAGQYLWLYSRSSGKKIQTYVAGSWADVTTTPSSAITLTLSSGATATYYAYRTDKFTATGSARYRLA